MRYNAPLVALCSLGQFGSALQTAQDTTDSTVSREYDFIIVGGKWYQGASSSSIEFRTNKAVQAEQRVLFWRTD